MSRFASKEEYRRWRASQGDAPGDDAQQGTERGQVYDGPPPASQEFVDRARRHSGLSVERDRSLAMWCHVTALAGLVIPFGNVLGPFIAWRVGRGDSDFVDEHGKVSLNFQLSITAFFVGMVLLAVLFGPIVLILAPVGGLAALYGVIMAVVNGVRAHGGDEAHYALSTRFLR
jgi:uncharacterized Tic20 family protein